MIDIANYKFITIYKKIYHFNNSVSNINLQIKDSLQHYTVKESKSTSDINDLDLNLKDFIIDYIDDYIDYEIVNEKTPENKSVTFLKKNNSYEVAKSPKWLKDYVMEKLNTNEYISITKNNTSNMKDDLIFMPMRLNADKSEIGAVISQTQLTEYVIFNDLFNAEIEKKIPILSLLTKPLVPASLITLDGLAS